MKQLKNKPWVQTIAIIVLFVLAILLFQWTMTGDLLPSIQEGMPAYEEALAYAQDYKEYVMTDSAFEDTLRSSLIVIRQEIHAYATWWSLIPPIIAILLALLTKEVYFSLFMGVLSGAMIYTNLHPGKAVLHVFDIMMGSVGDTWNIGILFFLVTLGILVNLMNRAGGSAAYGDWAIRKIRTKQGAMFSTFILGVVIFVDDYFNCLTVGSVMRPLTDKYKISRAKLAYLIDATAAPICIIAPISSWAAAVSSVAPEGEGLEMFIKAIPYNFYALLTLLMVVLIVVFRMDFGPMRKQEEQAAQSKEVENDCDKDSSRVETRQGCRKGKVIDLVFPVIILIAFCVTGMLYTGGFFEGTDFVTAFANCDASLGLVLGSFFSLVAVFILYLARRVLSFKEFMESIPEGFKAMVPAILILIFAWTLGGMTGSIGARVFVAELVRGSASMVQNFLPAIVFLIATGLSFATGTSWGTFGILLPILVSIGMSPEMTILSMSACLAGAVCGDHCSPISDTTIMASAGAQCDHIVHVSTQLPYALLVAGVSLVGFLLAGFIGSAWIVLPICMLLLTAILLLIRMQTNKKITKNIIK